MRIAIRAHGPCTLEPRPDRTPFQSLVIAVAHQQLHGAAAATILRRFRSLFQGRMPSPARLAATSLDTLRAVGFSRAKSAALHDIAKHALNGTIPNSAAIQLLPDETLIDQLTQIRGVGRWTVQMLLIFKLGRPDILPADDFGVRSGFAALARRPSLPTPSEILKYGKRWRPFATTAAWYLWRAADARKTSPPAPS